MPDTYVKMPEGDYVDICDEVRRLTDTEESLTSGDIVEALSETGGVWNSDTDGGKVVPPTGWPEGGLITQTSLPITENGTYDTTTNDSVVVNVSGGGGSGATVYTISGSGATPQAFPEGFDANTSFMEVGDDGSCLVSATLYVRLGTQRTMAMVYTRDNNGLTFKGMSGLGEAVAVMTVDYSLGTWPVSFSVGGNDYTQHIPNTTWVMTIFDRRND